MRTRYSGHLRHSVTYRRLRGLASGAEPTSRPAAVTNAPGIPGWAYPVAAGVPGPKDDGTIFHVRTAPSA